MDYPTRPAGSEEVRDSIWNQPGLTTWTQESDSHESNQNFAKNDVMAALSYGLGLVRHGAMLVAANGRPRIANQIAQAILQKGDGISLSQFGLVAERASDTRMLYQLLRDALSSTGRGGTSSSTLALDRRLSPNALIVRVVPGPWLFECWGPEHRTALLYIYDRDIGMVVEERTLMSWYGLTRREAALAAKLTQGRSIEEAAAELFISVHTARTHLKRIFLKTDTHRQPELVLRMMQTVA